MWIQLNICLPEPRIGLTRKRSNWLTSFNNPWSLLITTPNRKTTSLFPKVSMGFTLSSQRLQTQDKKSPPWGSPSSKGFF
ncbi:hypothetical protein D3C71_792270 [compost metagenome]